MNGLNDRDTSSSTYSDYKSNFDITIDVDKPVKNSLINLYDEPCDIFMLKNDFYSNYGIEIYLQVLEKYNKALNEIEFNKFNHNIWNKCLYLNNLHRDSKQIFCLYGCIRRSSNRMNLKNIEKLYDFLNQIHVNNIKTKLWIKMVLIEKNKGFTEDF